MPLNSSPVTRDQATRDEALFLARADLCYRNIHQSHFGVLLLWLVVWLLYADVARQPWFDLWLILFSVYVVVSFRLPHRFVRTQPDSDAAPKWARWLTLHNFALGTLWAVMPLLVDVQAQPFLMNLQILLIVAPWFGGAFITATLPQVFYAWSLPQLIVFEAVLMSYEGGGFIMGLVLAAYLVCVILSLNAGRLIEESLRLRDENLDLAEAAEAANQEKTRFLAAASHDLRQPLHALELFHEALAGRLQADEQRDLLGMAQRSSRELGGLLNALLDVSQLQLGAVEVRRAEVPLAPLYSRVIDEFQLQARQKGLALRGRPCAWVVNSDPLLLMRVLRNFVSNAIRHTEQGGILLGARRRGGMVRLTVWDTGPGIAAENQRHIFAEFAQLNNPERDRNKGLGLGLAIVRHLSALLSHPLALHSRPGRGSAFSIDVPLASPQPLNPPTMRQPVSPLPSIHDAVVLVVEDDDMVRAGLLALLSSWQCEVLLAASAEAALAVCRDNGASPPDLIMSDYHQPGGDTAIDVIERLRAHFARAIPALVISGDGASETARRVRDAGHLLLLKPVRADGLRAAMQQVLGCEG